LQGLFDSEGSISPNISRFSSYTLEIWTANNEVLNLAMTLLKKLGYRTSIYIQPQRIRIFHFPRTRIARTKQRCYALIILGDQDALYKFASEIGFREGKRRKRLATLLEAFKHPPKERQKVYRKILNTLPHTPPFNLKNRKNKK